MKVYIKTKNEILDELIYQIRDGVVLVENEGIVYDSSVTDYEFSASIEKDSPVAIDIIYLSGLTSEDNYIDNQSTINGIEPLVENTDYELWVDGGVPDTIDDNPYSTSHWAGTLIYDGVKFLTNKLKDGEVFYVTYRYYDIAKVSQVTNFSEGTLARTLVDSVSTMMSNIYNSLDWLDKQSYLDTATGSAIDNHGSLYGLTRYTGTVSSGYVVVTNSDVDTLHITPSNVFVTERTTDAVLFRSSASHEVTTGETKEIFITSTEVGKNQNVGVGTIAKIYLSDSLEEEVSGTYTCTNPSYISGALNLFDEGADRENDIELKSRIRRTTTKGVTSRKDSIENAVENLASVSFAKVQDWEENKLLAVGTFDALVVGEGSKLITKGNLEDIQTVIDDYKPIGTSYNIKRPHPVYVDVDLSIYIPTEHWSNKTNIENTVSTSVLNYVDSLAIGDDFKQSQLLKHVLEQSTELENAIIDDLTFTVYSYDPYEFDDVDAGYQVVNGTTYYDYAQGFQCTTKNYKNKQTYHSSTHPNAKPLVAHEGYVEDTLDDPYDFPMTYLAIQDAYGNWVRDPRYTIDYTDGVALQVFEYKVIVPANGAIVGRPLIDDDNVIYDYHYVKYDAINGVRFWLEMNSAADGITCDIDIYYSGATTEPTTKVGGITGYSLTYADVDASDLLAVDIEFTSPLTLVTGDGGSDYNDDPATQFWLVLQNWAGATGGESVKVYMSKAGDEIAPIGNPDVMVEEGGGWIDIADAGAGADWINRFMNIRTTLNIIDNPTYFDNDKDIEADLYTRYPEIIVLNNLNLTSSSVVVD